MGELQFGHGEKREFYPDYAGVDWHEAWTHAHPDNKDLPVWAETYDELGEFCEQLNQTNCVFYLNDTNPDFDCIVVVDHRDEGGDWWLPRVTMGSELFNSIVETFAEEVMVVTTKYPALAVAEYVMRHMFGDIQEL